MECFCQEPLENYFGQQRSAGGWKDNPTIHNIGYNDNTFCNQNVYWPIAGNVNIGNVVDVANEPIPRQKRAKRQFCQ